MSTRNETPKGAEHRSSGKKIATAAAPTAILALSAGSALAVSAHATGNVSVRTGPGTNYNRVDTLHTGESVDVRQCQSGWCYVEHSGPDGWVSANYLSQNGWSGGNSGGNSGSNSDPDIGFSFGFGSNGSHFGFSIGNQPNPGWNNNWPRPQPVSKVCFYSGTNYSGKSFCMNSGMARAGFGPIWNDKISSVRVYGNASVKMCQDFNYGGFCRTASRSEPSLGPWLNNRISSLAVN